MSHTSGTPFLVFKTKQKRCEHRFAGRRDCLSHPSTSMFARYSLSLVSCFVCSASRSAPICYLTALGTVPLPLSIWISCLFYSSQSVGQTETKGGEAQRKGSGMKAQTMASSFKIGRAHV